MKSTTSNIQFKQSIVIFDFDETLTTNNWYNILHTYDKLYYIDIIRKILNNSIDDKYKIDIFKQELIDLVFGGNKRFNTLQIFLKHLYIKADLYISSYGFFADNLLLLKLFNLDKYFIKINQSCSDIIDGKQVIRIFPYPTISKNNNEYISSEYKNFNDEQCNDILNKYVPTKFGKYHFVMYLIRTKKPKRIYFVDNNMTYNNENIILCSQHNIQYTLLNDYKPEEFLTPKFMNVIYNKINLNDETLDLQDISSNLTVNTSLLITPSFNNKNSSEYINQTNKKQLINLLTQNMLNSNSLSENYKNSDTDNKKSIINNITHNNIDIRASNMVTNVSIDNDKNIINSNNTKIQTTIKHSTDQITQANVQKQSKYTIQFDQPFNKKAYNKSEHIKEKPPKILTKEELDNVKQILKNSNSPIIQQVQQLNINKTNNNATSNTSCSKQRSQHKKSISSTTKTSSAKIQTSNKQDLQQKSNNSIYPSVLMTKQ